MKAKLTISDTTNEELVRFFYLVLLQRNPEPGGLVHWVEWLKTNSRKALLQQFVGSVEYKSKWTSDISFTAEIEELVTPIPVPTPIPAPIPTPIPIPPNAQLLPWGITALDQNSVINFAPGQKKIFVVRTEKNVRGFEVIFVPQSDFTVTCSFAFPLKPDGTQYSLAPGVRERLSSLWASYDGSLDLRIWSAALKGIVLDPLIYPGDFIITMTADKAGWGKVTTSLDV